MAIPRSGQRLPAAESVIAVQELPDIPDHYLSTGHIHVQLAGAAQQAAQNVEFLFGLRGRRLLQPGIDEVPAAIHLKAVVCQTGFDETGSQASSLPGGAAALEAESDVVFAGGVCDARIHQAEVVGEPSVKDYVDYVRNDLMGVTREDLVATAAVGAPDTS